MGNGNLANTDGSSRRLSDRPNTKIVSETHDCAASYFREGSPYSFHALEAVCSNIYETIREKLI